jgi:hypothetical protein
VVGRRDHGSMRGEGPAFGPRAQMPRGTGRSRGFRPRTDLAPRPVHADCVVAPVRSGSAPMAARRWRKSRRHPPPDWQHGTRRVTSAPRVADACSGARGARSVSRPRVGGSGPRRPGPSGRHAGGPARTLLRSRVLPFAGRQDERQPLSLPDPGVRNREASDLVQFSLAPVIARTSRTVRDDTEPGAASAAEPACPGPQQDPTIIRGARPDCSPARVTRTAPAHRRRPRASRSSAALAVDTRRRRQPRSQSGHQFGRGGRRQHEGPVTCAPGAWQGGAPVASGSARRTATVTNGAPSKIVPSRWSWLRSRARPDRPRSGLRV